VLQNHYKRPAIDLVKGKCRRKYSNRYDKNHGKPKRQERKEDERKPAAAGKIYKLFKGQGAKDLVLDLYKLRDLVPSHRS